MKQTEGTNFAKGGNLIASLCKTGYFPHRIFVIFLFKIKILPYKFLEHKSQLKLYYPCDFFYVFGNNNASLCQSQEGKQQPVMPPWHDSNIVFVNEFLEAKSKLLGVLREGYDY